MIRDCLPIEDHSVDAVVTDPPYYDNVQYGNLSAFFRVWLNRLLPEETDWMYDESLSAVAMTKSDGNGSYMAALTGIFTECARVLKPEYRSSGVYIPPLGPQCVGRFDFISQDCRF